MERMRLARALPLLLALTLLAAACGSGSGSATGSGAATGSPSTTPTGQQMAAIVATPDLYVGGPQRVSTGLVWADNRLVSFGTVGFSFSYLGTSEAPSTPKPGPTATATFLPTPGMPAEGSGPKLTQPSEARGIYEAQGVTFDVPGFWQVMVTADVQGQGTQRSVASFAVNEEPSLPAPGQPALRTENLTMASKDAPPAAIDSRYATEGRIPDPYLHRWTIARAVAEGKPALVIFATPVYCVSQFCGPETEVVQGLAKKYADRAVFIHVEIWRDFQDQVINEGAADWLYRQNNLTEPWLYLIGADGTIVDRWSSLFSTQEVEQELQRLPPMK